MCEADASAYYHPGPNQPISCNDLQPITACMTSVTEEIRPKNPKS